MSTSNSICFKCKKFLTPNEKEYCRKYSGVFRGNYYCRDCQKKQ